MSAYVSARPGWDTFVDGPFATKLEAGEANHDRLQAIADFHDGKVWNGFNWVLYPTPPSVKCANPKCGERISGDRAAITKYCVECDWIMKPFYVASTRKNSEMSKRTSDYKEAISIGREMMERGEPGFAIVGPGCPDKNQDRLVLIGWEGTSEHDLGRPMPLPDSYPQQSGW